MAGPIALLEADCWEGNMDLKVISSTDLRVKTRDIIESAKFENQHYIVETFGKPMVAIISVQEYERLMALEGLLSQATQDDRGQDKDPSDRIAPGTELERKWLRHGGSQS